MALSSFDAKAEWVFAEDTYNFGPEMSEAMACEKAERRAKEKALKSVVGEKISSEDNMVCSEMKDDAECKLNRSTWSTIDGLIKGTRKKISKTVPGISGFNRCTVSLEVDVGVAEGRPDPSFDLEVKLNKRIFRNGEHLKISLTPTKYMYINVFQFLPYQDLEKQITRIFPNSFDKKRLFAEKAKSTVPTLEGSQQYDLKVGFPLELRGDKDLIDEYLMVLGTKKPIDFRDEYSHEEFKTRLSEIPQPNRRFVRRGYNVVNPR
jgi:hypothetical protein